MNIRNYLLFLLQFPFLTTGQPCNLQPNATYGPSKICNNQDVYLYGTSTVPGVSYSWTGSGSFSSSLQNPVVSGLKAWNMPYTYILSVAKAGCNTEYDTIVVNNIISVPHTPKIETDSAVCTGDTLKLWLETVSLLVTTGYIYGPNLLPSISYVTTRDYIYIPNVSLADTGWYYAYAAHDDTSTCYTDTSKLYIGTNIIVQRPATAPIATITATPGTNVGPWVAVTFRANTLSAGSKPKYQWRKNGINIPGATDSVYTATTNVGIMTGDTITVWVQRGPVCIEDSVSAPVIVNINLGVEHIGSKTMSIYPNPNNGSFTIRGNYPLGEQQNIIISNLLGEVVYTTNHTITQPIQQITLPSSIAQGHYILKLTTTSSSETTPIIIQR